MSTRVRGPVVDEGGAGLGSPGTASWYHSAETHSTPTTTAYLVPREQPLCLWPGMVNRAPTIAPSPGGALSTNPKFSGLYAAQQFWKLGTVLFMLAFVISLPNSVPLGWFDLNLVRCVIKKKPIDGPLPFCHHQHNVCTQMLTETSE